MSALNDLLDKIQDKELKSRIQAEVDKLTSQKKFGLVFEEHLPECTPLYGIPIRKGTLIAQKMPNGKITEVYTVLAVYEDTADCVKKDSAERRTFPLHEIVAIAEFGNPIYPYLKQIDTIYNADDTESPTHAVIEADNYHALQLLEYLYAGTVDCIYIDPPYNTGAKDWKYNNDYVDTSDEYRHSKWLSMMKKRLVLAKKLLNPADSVLIVTIDEKEYLHLGCLLEELFPEARIQMVSSCIMPGGVSRGKEFARSDEYIYFVKFGISSPVALQLDDEWLGGVKNTSRLNVHWEGLLRTGTNNMRSDRPNLFYPILVSVDGKKFIGAGEPLSLSTDRTTYKVSEGNVAIWPIHSDGSEGCWRVGRETLLELQRNHVVRLGSFTTRGMAINYLKQGEYAKVQNGTYKVKGINEDGSYELDDSDYKPSFIPSTQWTISSHDASRHGSGILRKLFNDKVFSFPKSLYAVHDALRFFVANKPDALIVDFFAGAGTTLHAVNLLNAEDGGHRQCVLITNNEVSAEEAKLLSQKGYNPGDAEWERLGIARYVTWPRTVCSIQGKDINGNPLKGTYLGSDMPMSDGFKANAAFFKLGFLDKNSVALGRQFKELLSILWLKAGAFGECPIISEDVPPMLFFPKNKFAVLVEEYFSEEFAVRIKAYPQIETVYIITDSEKFYQEIADNLPVKQKFQLYKSYLDNFRINTRR